MNLPSVTVAIPTYNESANLEQVILSFLETNYSNLLEILVADGGSTDGTQEIVRRISLSDTRVTLLENPLRIQSAALKLMLDEAKGDVFLRADAHCEYAPDYLEKCVFFLIESKSFNVGGAQRFAAKNFFQAGVALGSKSFLGSGKAKYRDPNYCGYAETVFLGCFWREVLLDVGGYKITRKEDTELNLRLLERNTKAIYINSEIKVWYFPRKNWKSLWNQYVKYGRGCYLIAEQYPGKLPFRSNLPFYFISSILFVLSVDLVFFKGELRTILLIIVGFTFTLIEAFHITSKFNSSFDSVFWRGKKEEIPSFIQRYFFCWLVLLTIPIAHFAGYIYQIFRQKILKIKESYFLETGYEIQDQTSETRSN